MNIYEQMCVTKLFYIAMGMMPQNTITISEIDIACEILKHMADQRSDWNNQQRITYKWLVDYANDLLKGS